MRRSPTRSIRPFRVPLSLSLLVIFLGFSILCFQFKLSTMVDLETVCCMCGDIGFPDKLFRCNNCHHRFQHSYCSNYYTESIRSIEQCDWCQSEKRSTKHGSSATKSVAGNETATTTTTTTTRSENPGYKIKRHDREGSSEKGKSSSGVPSPRSATRRYKLLKDVMC